MNLVEDVAKLIRHSLEDLPEVEPLENDHSVINKDDVSITNEMWKCKGMRKLHLEIGYTDHLEVLHCVLFPDPRYNLPIFGCDVVDNGKIVTAAIVDISPVTGVNKFYDKIKPIADQYNDFEFRHLPDWADIFSPYCKFMRLIEDIEKANYYNLLLHYLIEYTKEIKEANPGSPLVTYQRHQDQVRYCTQQRKNVKTEAVLGKWFGKEWARTYIDTVLFDNPKGTLAL